MIYLQTLNTALLYLNRNLTVIFSTYAQEYFYHKFIKLIILMRRFNVIH
jgi:hypothetical protein